MDVSQQGYVFTIHIEEGILNFLKSPHDSRHSKDHWLDSTYQLVSIFHVGEILSVCDVHQYICKPLSVVRW